MRSKLRRAAPVPENTLGRIQVDRRTKDLTKRLRQGDIAVINHADIDRVSAEALVACRPSAVVNAARSSTGRYPNVGPGILVAAGIPLLDDVGEQVMDAGLEGAPGVLVDEHLMVDGKVVATGTVMTAESVDEAMELADLVVVMSMGRIEQIGKPSDIRARPATPFAREFITP